MLILAIDTSERYTSTETPHAGSIGLFEPSTDKALTRLSRISLDPGTDHAADLTTNISTLLESVEKTPQHVELAAVTKGPGSFTGLRVGVSTAKTFAFALSIPAIGVNTLDAIAQNTPPEFENAYVVYDARRGYVYSAIYNRSGGKMFRKGDYSFLPSAESAEKIPENAAVFGPGCAAYSGDFPSAIQDPALTQVRIDIVAGLALAAYLTGSYDNVHNLNPLYLRPSAAEEKRAASGG